MKLTLIRVRYDESGVYGKLLYNNTILCYTLEHSYGEQSKLPDGNYKCVRGEHILHSGPIETFEVMDVPGHKGILFHKGNTEDDSEGCVLLGLDIVGDKLVYSGAAFNNFLKLTKNLNEFDLEVLSVQTVEYNHY